MAIKRRFGFEQPSSYTAATIHDCQLRVAGSAATDWWWYPVDPEHGRGITPACPYPRALVTGGLQVDTV